METNRLKRIFRKYANDKLPEEAVLEKCKDAEPMEMWHARLSLMMDGNITESQAKPLADIINRLTRGRTNMLKDLPTKHPLRIFLMEHRQMEKLFRMLENLEINEYEEISSEVEEQLKDITEKMMEIEKHETREEKNLLPRLVELSENKKGVAGMVKLIKIRHSQLMRDIVKLRNLSLEEKENSEMIVKNRDELLYSMRDHNFKENRILYPLALEIIEDWDEIKEENEQIGYINSEMV